MAESNIEWTNTTWNPTTGCTKISKECDNCYAEVMTNRMMHMSNQPRYEKGFDVFVEHEEALSEPHKWKKPKTVFVNSMSDLFHKDISLEFLQKIFKVMNDTPQHTYQVLTKRHHELEKYSSQLNWSDNIWMGVSVGHVAGERRIESLVKCGAKHKFLSIEPLIEELSDLNLKGIDWVICGGESGDNKARPIEKNWILKVKKNCEQYNIPFFFKQWGKQKFNPNPNDPTIDKQHRYHAKGGCMIDGELFLQNPCVKDDSVPMINIFNIDYYVMDEFHELKTIWELKSYLPMMEIELFDQLKNDIKINGLNDPILYLTTSEGSKLVIEGHTRLKACLDLKLKEIPIKEIKETFNSLEEIKLWMIKHQFQRRNLSSVEKIQLAYLSKDTIEVLAKINLSKGGKNTQVIEHIDTNEEIAKIAGVGRTTVVRYASVINKGSKIVINKVNKGEISISSAYELTKGLANKKDKKVRQKKTIECIIINSIEEGNDKIHAGIIDGYLVVSELSKSTLLPENLKRKVGIMIIGQ